MKTSDFYISTSIHDNPYNQEDQPDSHSDWASGYVDKANHWMDEWLVPSARMEMPRAYLQGYDHVQVGFNPTELDMKNPAISAIVRRSSPGAEVQLSVLYRWDVSASDQPCPRWSKNNDAHRSFAVPQSTLVHMMKAIIPLPIADGQVELPCPPYEFDIEDGQLTISDGAFIKSGGRSEWEAFIDTLQAEVEKMPKALDVSDADFSVKCSTTARYSKSLSVTGILRYHDMLNDDEEWLGTKDELIEAIEEAVRGLDTSDLEPDFVSDVDMDEEVYAEADDLHYDLSTVE